MLLLCAHGSRAQAAQRATEQIAAAVAAAQPEIEVVLTWVDVQTPDAAQRCAQFADRPVVIVPLLLSAGYHVRHDLARAVAGRPQHVVTAALGPDRGLSRLLARRILEAEAPALAAGADRSRAPLVLLAAGSSDERAVADVRRQAQDLAVLTGRSVTAGFVSAAQPTAAQAVQSAAGSADGAPTAVSFHVAPGVFHASAVQAARTVPGAWSTAPLLAQDEPVPAELVDVVVARWHEGLRALPSAS